MKILFISNSRIGDVVLSTGIIHYFYTLYPQATFTIVCPSLVKSLFCSVPNLENIWILKKKKFYRHWFELFKQAQKTKWDIIIDLRGSLTPYFFSADKKYIWKKTNKICHKVEQISDFIQSPQPLLPTLWLDPSHIEKAHYLISKKAPVLAISPLAHWIGKQWPYFDQLVEQFLHDHQEAFVAFFCACHERPALEPILKGLPSSKVIVISEDLLTVAACLKSCSIFIGNDSGLMHLSAAIDTPTIGLFGPSDDRVYGPYGSSNVVIRTPLSFEEIQRLPGFAFDAPQSFMDSLSVEEVYPILKEVWAKHVL